MVTPIGKRLFTVSEYHKLAAVGILKPTDRVELIKGEIIQMIPIKSYHAGIVNRLARILNKLLDKKATITTQNPVCLGQKSEPEPDITIAKYRKDDYMSKHPQAKDLYLVIEVSDSTLKYDRKTKAPLYAKANIPEYWFINLQDEQAEVYRKPKNGKYEVKEIKQEEDTVKCSSINFSLVINDLFA